MKHLIAIAALLGSWFLSFADDKPSFPGGAEALKKYLAANTKYPEIAKENYVEGIVEVGFTVMTDGSLQEIKIVKFVDPELEKEAIRVVGGMPAWIPAEKDGVAIDAPSKVEVPFLLD